MRDPMAPVKILAVEDDTDHVILRSDGQVRRAVHLHMDEESVGRMGAGYVCIHCYEPQHEAFPEKCHVCGYQMRERQAERFALEFKGNIRIGPSTSLEDEMLIAEEIVRREEQAKLDPILRPSQVWLP